MANFKSEIEEFIKEGRSNGSFVGIFCIGDWNEPSWEIEDGEEFTCNDSFIHIYNPYREKAIDISYRDITHLEMQSESFY